jgi:hypothetical protein
LSVVIRTRTVPREGRNFARTLSAISAATFGSVFVRKCVAPMRALIVPKGY